MISKLLWSSWSLWRICNILTLRNTQSIKKCGYFFVLEPARLLGACKPGSHGFYNWPWWSCWSSSWTGQTGQTGKTFEFYTPGNLCGAAFVNLDVWSKLNIYIKNYLLISNECWIRCYYISDVLILCSCIWGHSLQCIYLDFHKFKTRLTFTIPSFTTQLSPDSLDVLLLIDPPTPVVFAVCKK